VEAEDGDSAAMFVEDDLVEAGSLYLRNFDAFTVMVLASAPIEIALAVSHWPSHVIAIVCALVFAFFTVIGILGGSPLVVALFFIAFLASLWLLLSYGRTTVTQDGVRHEAPLGRHAIDWGEIKSALVDSGGNTVVLKGEGKQLVLPHFVFWAGPDKHAAQAFLLDELDWRGVQLKHGFAAFHISRNTRVT
jgi:hypothetical protein